MRSPEMWLNPGDHSSAITAEFCNFFVVVDVTLHFSLQRSWVLFPLQHLQPFSATSTTSVKKLTQLYVCQLYSNFLSKVFFRVGGLIKDLRSRFLIFMSPVRDCFLLLVGLISLGEPTIFQELKLSSPPLFFFCDTNTEDLTSSWICTEQGNSCLYAPELWKLPRESHAVPS